MRILLIEDNHRLSSSIRLSLVDEGYAVDTAFDGPEGEGMAEYTPFDLVILDVMLPGRSGFEVCANLRRKKIKTPILMLTARDAVEDRVMGLDSGADDYLVKPFAMQELGARIRALLRREAEDKSGQITFGELILDPASHQVWRAERLLELTAKEFALLEYFMRNPNRLITRDMAEDHIWNYDFQNSSNVVDVYMRRLRRKVDDPFAEKYLETVRGAGYRLHKES